MEVRAEYIKTKALQKGATEMHENRVGLKNRIKGIAKAALALSMCLVMPLTSLPVMASESNEMVDLDRLGSISLTFTYYDENDGKTYPVTGGNSVGLYKVADAVVDNGFKFVTDERFASVGEIPATDEELDSANLDLAEAMASIAKDYDYDVAPKEMDSEGKVSFDGLEVGLYLVLQAAQGDGNNQFVLTPFLISIPGKNADGSLNYDVNANAKPIGIAKEEVPPPPKPPVIPQTGQLWWPVIALGIVGALAVTIGLVRRMKSGS